MVEARSTQSSNKSGMHLLNAFPTSENIKLQTSNFKHPECLSPPTARWHICNARTKTTGSLTPLPFQVQLGAGEGVAAGSVCDSGRKIAQYRKGLSSFARNPRPAQFHSRADQGRTCDGVEARGNALPSYHGRGMVE